MSKSKLVLVSCVAIVTGLFAARTASGNVSHTNYLTFSAPFALPGVTLPAGTYAFESGISGSYDVVRVMSRARGQLYFTAFTKRVDRPRGLAANRQIVFGEAPARVATPVKAWFPIGGAIGHEFVYPAGDRHLLQGTK